MFMGDCVKEIVSGADVRVIGRRGGRGERERERERLARERGEREKAATRPTCSFLTFISNIVRSIFANFIFFLAGREKGKPVRGLCQDCDRQQSPREGRLPRI
jgi:hypothetical protein